MPLLTKVEESDEADGLLILLNTMGGVSQTFHYFERIQDRICDFVTRNSRISREDFEGLMLNTGEMAADVGSVIYGEEAVRLGLIDHLGGLSDALACLHQMMREDAERLAQERGGNQDGGSH